MVITLNQMKYIIFSEQGPMFFSETDGQLCYCGSSNSLDIVSSDGFQKTYFACQAYTKSEAEYYVAMSNNFRGKNNLKTFEYYFAPIEP